MTTRTDKGAIYICIMSFANNDGSFREGERVRGSEPAVRKYPEFFIADGYTEAEYRSARYSRFPDVPPGVVTGFVRPDPSNPRGD